MKFPVLFKKSSGRSLLTWEIETDGRKILVRHGQVGGKIQEQSETISEGKNLGRTNETTPEEQAELEAASAHRKKIERHGYVTDPDRAVAGETDTEGGIAPMLAQPWEKAERHIKWPCDAQRKINGVRGIVVIQDGDISIWSRKRTRILGVPHLVEAYRNVFKPWPRKEILILDGEIYRIGWTLQRISGYVRKKADFRQGFLDLQHHVYDVPSHEGPWHERRDFLKHLFMSYLQDDSYKFQHVESVSVTDFADVKRLHDAWVQEGFEGAILRNRHALYQPGRRSPDLAKVKEFQDQEFPILAVKEGRGKFEGRAIFTCQTAKGQQFDCCAPGTLENRAEYFRRANELIGKQLTVKFFEWSEDRVPIFPVGVAVRDYE